MKKLKKLQLSKEIIASLNNEELNNVIGGATAGCTDGCSVFFATLWNCTMADCSANCNTNAICGGTIKCAVIKKVNDSPLQTGEVQFVQVGEMQLVAKENVAQLKMK
jgi:natural product precursor